MRPRRFVAARHEELHPASGRFGAHLFRQSRLTGARLAGEEDEAAAALERGVDVETERRAFVLAVDEGRTSLRCRSGEARVGVARGFEEAPAFPQPLEPEEASIDALPVSFG